MPSCRIGPSRMDPIKYTLKSSVTAFRLTIPFCYCSSTLIFIFLVLTKQATGMGCPGSTAFSINGDTVKQPNTEGGSWLSPSLGLHINETTPHCSQLQPLPDRCLWSKTTSRRRLNPHLLTVTIPLHTYIISPLTEIYIHYVFLQIK